METFSKPGSAKRAVVVAVAPVLLLASMIWHPFIPGRLPNNAEIAQAVSIDTTRWGLSHLSSAFASAVLVLAFIVIRGLLRESGDRTWSAIGLGFIVIGSLSYTVLPGMEFAPLAAVESGVNPIAVQAALQDWFTGVLMVGALTFAIGVVGIAIAVLRYAPLSRVLAWVVVVALIVMAVSRIVPLAAIQFYVQGVAALIALWPLAWAVWTRHEQPRSAEKRVRNAAACAGAVY
jgi:hypothetical protein